MARMTIDNPDLLKLLPQFMRNDEANKAFAESMNVLFAEAAKSVRIIRKWDQIDNMNHAQLNEMAWELNVDWWDSAFSLETKKAIIKTCYRVHEKRGTKWAVEELVNSAFGYGKVTEWFEYGGEPFYFKIQTNATLTKDGMTYFLNMIDKVKSVRSHVEMIEIKRDIVQQLNAGAACLSFSRNVIVENINESVKIYSNLNTGIVTGSYGSKNTIKEEYHG